MSVNPVNLSMLSDKIRSIGIALNTLFADNIVPYTNFVIALGSSGLQAAPYNMSSGDATLLFNSCQDLANLYKVYQGLMYVASGATVNTGVPTANGAGAFGYPFNINVNQCLGLGC